MIYVMSDLHGYCLDRIKSTLERIGFSDSDYCYVLGDVIDRGFEGVKILRWLMTQPNITLLLGNHEAMMLSCSFLFDEITDESVRNLSATQIQTLSLWTRNGGKTTIDGMQAVPAGARKYIIEFLRESHLYETVSIGDRDFLLTHSGIDNFEPDKKLCDYNVNDFLWARPTLNTRYYDSIITVFGHTPTLLFGYEYDGKPVITDTWIDIDAGAAAGRRPIILRLDDMKYFTMDHL